MASYQDIEVRLQQVERKLDFVMKAMAFPRKEGIIAPKIVVRSLLDLYLEKQGAGLGEPITEIVEPPAPPLVEVTDNGR